MGVGVGTDRGGAGIGRSHDSSSVQPRQERRREHGHRWRQVAEASAGSLYITPTFLANEDGSSYSSVWGRRQGHLGELGADVCFPGGKGPT